MNWWQRVRGRWQMEDDLDAELRFHFDRLVDDFLAEGLTRPEALRRARSEFGGIEAVKDDCRDARGTRWVHDIAQDVRFSARLLAKERGLTAIAVLALALGIGVNTTLFTVVDAICLRGLPIAAPDRVVDLSERDAHRILPLSSREVDVLRTSRPSAIEDVAAYTSRPATLRDDRLAAESVTVAYVTTNALRVIRQPPMLGRDFREDEGQAEAAPVALLSANVWRDRYGSDAGVVGSVVTLNTVPVTVVGVMPDGFNFPDDADLWCPLGMLTVAADARTLKVYARLAPHATLTAARESVGAVMSRLPDAAGDSGTLRAVIVPINDRYRGDITNPAWIVFMTVGVLLVVIACSNVANLLLAHGARRAREIAIRLSLGATRLRIVRQLLVESALLSAAGGVAAIGVASAGLRLLRSAIPKGGLPYFVSLTMDGRVAAVLVAVCLGSVFLFGLAPALQLARTMPHAVIKEASATASQHRAAARWTWFFLTAQLALTVMLLSKLGYSVGMYYAQSREPVIDASQILTFGIILPERAYAEPARRAAFYGTLAERLRAMERSSSVALLSALPWEPAVARRMTPDGQPLTASSPEVKTVAIDEEYFRTLGLSLVEGRPFARDLTLDARTAIIVNQRFAELFFPGAHAVGRRVRMNLPPGTPGPDDVRTIVGIAPSMLQPQTLAVEPAAFLPLNLDAISSVRVLVRASSAAPLLAPVIRDEVRRLDPDVPIRGLMTLERATWTARWNPRVSTDIITIIACIALLLATIGLAAMTAHAVARRSRELGIRLALGAAPPAIVLLVLRRVILQVSVGVLVGTIGAKAWDHGTTAVDLMTASVVVILVTLAVSAWPAARAGRIDPLRMLRDA